MENTEEAGHREHGGENDQKVEGGTSVSNWKFRKPLSPDEKDLRIDTEEDELESTRAKIGEAREENERLKTVLSQIVKDYKSLQMHFFDIVQQEQSKKSFENSPKLPIDHHHAQEPHELVSLSLGTCSTEIIKGEEINGSKLEVDDGLRSDGLITLGLEHKNIESSNLITGTSSFEEAKEEDREAAVEAWPPSKMIRDLGGEDDDVASQSNIGKRARVSVRARCDGPTMNDGCQWRKYGQKVSKGNPCPRAYYRCTVAPGCPVRKQVQRCIDDMSILITTYEGTHNHPLPVSATAMASTTSAAAHMLTSGPTTPRPAIGSTSLASTSGPNGSFYISNPYPYPSPSTSHPTITLDLTSNSSMSSTSTTSQYLYPAGSSQLNHWHSSVSSGLSYNYPPPQQRSSLSTDTIARAITSDPSFQSALVAAITSYVGASGAAHGSAFGSMRREGSGASPVTMFGTAAGLSTGTKSASASGSPVDERKQND